MDISMAHYPRTNLWINAVYKKMQKNVCKYIQWTKLDAPHKRCKDGYKIDNIRKTSDTSRKNKPRGW